MDNFEKKTIEKLRHGDIETLEYIYHLYSISLVKYAYRFISDENIAKDMVQEVFYNIWKKYTNINIHQSLEAFLYTSVKNQCINYLKQENKKKKYSHPEKKIQDMEIHYYENATENTIHIKEMQNHIHEAIDTLPDKSRQIFKMSRFDEKKNKEIGRELNISLKAVEKHITRALKEIRNHLGYS